MHTVGSQRLLAAQTTQATGVKHNSVDLTTNIALFMKTVTSGLQGKRHTDTVLLAGIPGQTTLQGGTAKGKHHTA